MYIYILHTICYIHDHYDHNDDLVEEKVYIDPLRRYNFGYFQYSSYHVFHLE